MKKVERPLWPLGGVGVDTHNVQEVCLGYAVLVEHSLVVPNDDELASALSLGGVALVFGVVVEHFSAVGEELARSEDMLDPELITKAIKGRPDTLKRYTSSTNSGEYVALGETDERDGSPAVNGHGGDDGIADHRRPPPPHVPVATCPGPERRCGDVEVTGCFDRRVERHHKTVVVADHDLILAPMTDTAGDPTPGVIALRTSPGERLADREPGP